MKDISKSDMQNNLPLVTRQVAEREIKAGNVTIGGERLTIMAGPCTVESKSQINEVARAAKDAGAHMLRGGIFKPLTFPYGDPLGLGDRDSDESSKDRMEILGLKELYKRAEKRFEYFKEAADKCGLPIISEIVYAESADWMEKYVDMYQIGYRHMFNMDIIERLSKSKKPVMIKRHYGESLRSLLGVAEHFEARGKHNFVFCERGIVVPHTHTVESRAVLDIQAIPALKEYAPTVPVIIDPSHATFKRMYVAAMSRAAIAAGADGLLIEVHPTPEDAWVDPLQALDFSSFKVLMKEIEGIAKILGRSV